MSEKAGPEMEWRELAPNPEDLDFKKLFDCDGNGIVSAICIDYQSGEVAMEGYMTPLAYIETYVCGFVTFWSRSRQELWGKGETSGDFMEVVSIRSDCDSDTLLIAVKRYGPTCHTGADTCFVQEGGVM